MQKVAVAVIMKDTCVLVCQRRRGARYELKWEFPGGKVEPNETIEECLQRELVEELSIVAGPTEKTEVEVSHYEDGKSYEVHYCIVSSFTGEPRNNVFEQFRWVDARNLLQLDILEGNKEFVRRLAEGPLSRTPRP